MRQSELIAELEKEVKELMDSISELEAEALEERKKVEKAYMTGYVDAGGEERNAYKAWLEFAAREGWEV